MVAVSRTAEPPAMAWLRLARLLLGLAMLGLVLAA